MSMPAVDDLFRPTFEGQPTPQRPSQHQVQPQTQTQTQAPHQARPAQREAEQRPSPAAEARPGQPQARRSSGRVRHDEKMTVYVTADELLEIEHARLSLRRDQGLAVDRGRLVREALAIVLADLEEHGDDSELVRRLTAR